MTAAQRRATDYVLWTAALAWPFCVFLQTPIAGIGLLTIVSIILLFLLVPDAIAARKLRIPFEVWAPALLITAVALVEAWIDPQPVYRDALEALLLLTLVIQANPSREAVHRYVFAGAVSAGIVALLSLGAPWLGLLPTAFTLRSSADFTFAYTITEAVHVLLVGAVFSLHVALAGRSVRWQRGVAVLSLLGIVALLVVRGMDWQRDTAVLPGIPYPGLRWNEWIALAVALWLVVRVLAKVEMDRRANADPLHRLWWFVGVLSVTVAAFAPMSPRPYHGLLLGFACATALPARTGTVSVRRPIVGTVVVFFFVAINLFIVFPANTNDPRQYDAAAEREMPRVFDRMDWVDRYAPNERRTYLWRARAAMEFGLPNFSSFAFERATRPPMGVTVLAPPTEAERQRFLVRMRDMAASMPEDRAVCAYERVLLANGERDAALYSLRLRTGIPLIHVESEDAAPYVRIAALILGDPGVPEDLRTWSADEVLTLLSLWGTDVAFARRPEEAPGGLFVLAAQRSWDAFNVHVRVGDKVTEFAEPLAPVAQRDIEPLTHVSAMVWAGPYTSAGGGNTRYTLNVLTSDGVRPAAYVDVDEAGGAQFTWTQDPPVVAFTPAVRVRIGK